MKISKQEKANKILKILENYYPKTPVPLRHSSPYTLLIAVLLSAQCTDERVNKITPILFKKANTCLLYTSPSPRDKRQSRMPSSA